EHQHAEEATSGDITAIEEDAVDGELAQADQGTQIAEEYQHVEEASSGDTIAIEEDTDDEEFALFDEGNQITEEHQHAEEATSGDITAIEEDAVDGELAQADQGTQIAEEYQHAEEARSRDTIAIEENTKNKSKKIIYTSLTSIAALIAIIIYYTKDLFIQKNIDKTEIIETSRPVPIKKTTSPEAKKTVLTSKVGPVSSNKVIQTPPKHTTTQEITDYKNLPDHIKARCDFKSSPGFIIYEVVKGDTLYEITEHFTGYGFDYFEVAKENNIENPDLIFPKDKIKYRIKKK
ncbi:MAG: LysM domain-containing protein, partial [Spirochaetota bacterium]|nr:LysM domain-containing protein [Spirochaetota bacterium]